MSEVRMAIVGDITFSRFLAEDPMAAVGRIRADLRDELRADILVANLECTLGKPVRKKGATRETRALTSSPAMVPALRMLGVDAVTLANNHILDGGVDGLTATLRALRQAGIGSFGAGVDYTSASAPLFLDRHGLRVGLVGFCGCEYAGRNKPGSLPLDASQSRRLIGKAKNNCDFLIVYFHEGIEALNYPMRRTMKSCHRAVRCGADLVVGTHPHTVQGIEWYQGVPIAYSLGNFIMPLLHPEEFAWWYPQTALMRMGRPFDRKTVARAMILKVTIGRGHRTEVEGVPMLLDETGLPRLPVGPEMAEERALFDDLCQAFLRPNEPIWCERDRIERLFCRLDRSDIHWGYVLRNLHRLRWGHVVSYLKMWR